MRRCGGRMVRRQSHRMGDVYVCIRCGWIVATVLVRVERDQMAARRCSRLIVPDDPHDHARDAMTYNCRCHPIPITEENDDDAVPGDPDRTG